MPQIHKVIDIDKGWKKILDDHRKLKSVKIKIGLFGEGDASKNVAARGAVHEFGVRIKITEKMRKFLHVIGIHVKKTTKKIIIPQRAFTRGAFDNNKKKLILFINRQYTLFVENKIDFKTFLNRIGVKHINQIKESIGRGDWKANHPITIERKGSSRPLIDTGVMINSVKHKIEIGVF